MSETETHLLKGPMPKLEKMKINELREECQMWRKIYSKAMTTLLQHA
ncbi:MAG: hypothetical protein K6T73_08145 [Candidatus Bathyarchaeota archaeon]|nr:hypothetical protein [Candidatus Bathyarchaeota archaeon]